MADDSQDPTSDQEVLKTQNYLGHPTTVLSGQQGDISTVGQGVAPGPAAAPTTGTGGVPGTPAGPVGRTGGSDALLNAISGLAQKGIKLADLIGNDQTRGDSGSLSDQLRSKGVSPEDIVALESIMGQGNTPANAGTLSLTQPPPGITADTITQMLNRTPAELESGGALLPDQITQGLFGGGGAEAGTGALGAAGGAAAEVAPYVGALVNIAQEASKGGTPPTQQALDAAVDVAAAALAGETFGLSMVAAPIAKKMVGETLTDVGLIGKGKFDPKQLSIDATAQTLDVLSGAALAEVAGFDLFGNVFAGGKGSYIPKREAAGQEGATDINTLGSNLAGSAQEFVNTGAVDAPLKALQTQFGERNPVRTDLNLTPEIAKTLGLPPGVNSWSSLNTDQFTNLLSMIQNNPQMLDTLVKGSGDVAYLPQSDAQLIANNTETETKQFLTFLAQNYQAPATAATAPTPTTSQVAATGGAPTGTESGAALTKDQLQQLIGA